MPTLNLISFFGIFGLCFIAWLFSENRSPRVFPWRTVIAGIFLQLVLGAGVFLFPPTRDALQIFSNLLNVVFDAADFGARFVFGRNIVPPIDKPPDVNLGYIFAFRALPTVIFFSGLMALLYNIGVIQVITNGFAKIFYGVMRLSGAESLSGAANIFVGIEAAIVVKPFLARMTRSELCAILACCFGTAASSTLAIYVSFLKPAFPNILGHLVSASIMAIPACFVLSKILVPETGVPLTMGGLPKEGKASQLRTATSRRQLVADEARAPMAEMPVNDEDEQIARLLRGEEPLGEERPERRPERQPEERRSPRDLKSDDASFDDPEDGSDFGESGSLETVAGEPIQCVSPLDAAIIGALDGVKMAVSIAAVLILILGLVYLLNQIFAGLATLPDPLGSVFKTATLANILGFLFLPVTFLTGVSLDTKELWEASVIIGRRLLETAIPPYQALAQAASLPEGQRVISDRAVLIISYALSGFAHLASVGIFVGGTIALIPSRRKDISELGWKALFVGTLATIMIGSVSGVFYTPGNTSILGVKQVAPAPTPSTMPAVSPSPVPTTTPTIPAAGQPTAAPAPVAPVPADSSPSPSP
jgi:CNT family concentrative nucleoside transporter